jgi:hypothetical protein
LPAVVMSELTSTVTIRALAAPTVTVNCRTAGGPPGPAAVSLYVVVVEGLASTQRARTAESSWRGGAA